ncbi:hypothetical protein GGF46_001644 [Coemansia sp. RSA 552]|nr:hypothetical protein GGF46_001644 [Coemansia sp. RSA 552]
MANQPGVPDAQLLPKAEDAVAEWQSNTEIEDRSEAFADAVGDEDDFADFGEPDDFGDFGHLESVPVSAKDSGPTLESTLEQASALIHRTDGRSSPSPVLAQCMEYEIRRIAAQATYSPESQAGEKSRLHHALESLRLLVAAKEQEAAKRRDSVLAYNQVIQTLVAQASKLH